MSLVESVKRAGIIGCGGAGFPTHVKVAAKADIVVANGAECEPLLNTDQRVMEHYADDLVEGMRLVMASVGATKGYIGIKKGYRGAVRALESVVAGVPGIQIALLDNAYPAGDEHILLTDITGRVVPEGGIPLDVGAVVDNVLTLVQIARAARGEPVTAREVTLVGEVRKPQVVTAAIGTRIRDLLDIAGPCLPPQDIAVIDGGPMMGRLVDLNASVNKTTSGFLFLPADHPLITMKTLPMAAMIRRSVAACCQCRLCTDVCSRFLQGHAIEPHLMMRALAYRLDEPTRAMTAAFLCSQCGLCEFACPMDLSPKRAFAEILGRLRTAGMANPHREVPSAVHEFRQYRKIGKDRLTRRYQLSRYDSHDLPLTSVPEPAVVQLSLNQAIGPPAQPVVGAGDAVAKGDLVAAMPEGKLGANLHASISGRVTAVNGSSIVLEGQA